MTFHNIKKKTDVVAWENVPTHPCHVSLVVLCLSHPQCSHSPLSCILGRTLPLSPSMFPITLVVYPQSYSASPTLNVPTHPCRVSLIVLCFSHPQCSHSPLSCILSRTLPLPPSMSPLTLVVYPQSYSASPTLNVPTHPCRVSLVVLCLSHPQCCHSPLSCIHSRTLPLPPSMFPLTLVVYHQSYSASLTLNVPTHPCRVSLVVLCLSHPQCSHSPLSCILSRTLPLPPSMSPLTLVVYPQSYSAYPTLNDPTHPCRVSLVVPCLSHPQCCHSPLSCILSRTLPLSPSMFPLNLVVYPQSYSTSLTLNVPTHPCRVSLGVLCLSHPQCSHLPLSCILSRTLPLSPSMVPLTLVMYPQSYSASLTLNVATQPCHVSLVVLCLSHPQCSHSPCRVSLVVLCLSHPQCCHSPLSCILSRTLPLPPSMFPLTLVVYHQSYSASLTLNVATHHCRVSLVVICLSHPQCSHSPLSCILSRTLPLPPSMFPLTLVVYPYSYSASPTLNVPTHPCRVSLVVLCLSHPQCSHSSLSCILSRTLPLPPSMFPLTLVVYPQSYSGSPTRNVPTQPCSVSLVVLYLSHPQCSHSPLSCILSRTLPLSPSMFPLTFVGYPQSYSTSLTLNVPTHTCHVSLVVLCLYHPQCCHSTLSCILSRTLPLSPLMLPLTLVVYPQS